jgi:hypothetical protein
MATKADRCARCGCDVEAIVRTAGGFVRVCGACVDKQHGLSVAWLPAKVDMNYSTAVPDFPKRVRDMKEGKR